MNKKYSILIGSDVNYERLIADIEFDDNLICVVSQERGEGIYDVEICPMHKGVPVRPTIDLAAFEEALQAAKKSLQESRAGVR